MLDKAPYIASPLLLGQAASGGSGPHPRVVGTLPVRASRAAYLDA